MNYKTTTFIACIILGLGLCACNKQAGSAERPNIVWITSEDNSKHYIRLFDKNGAETPNIENLAAHGIVFTRAFSNAPVCSAARSTLISGIYGPRIASHYHRNIKKAPMPESAEMFPDAGYQTGFIGKWHLNDTNDLSTWACNRGFDYLDKIDRDTPFFLFMSYRAPHAHERYISKKVLYAERGWPEIERMHAAKITLLDIQIGRMLKKLEEMGELENMFILFSSDNGPHHEEGHHEFFNSNGKLKAYKRDLYEGGIRVPFIACWKGEIKPGTTTSYVGGFQDIMPTIAEAIGIEVPGQSNGISLLPVLTGNEQKKHEYLNWEFQLALRGRRMADGGFRQAVRMDNWKAVRNGTGSSTELYDLNKDIWESENIAAGHPEMVHKMNRLFEKARRETAHFPYGGVIQD